MTIYQLNYLETEEICISYIKDHKQGMERRKTTKEVAKKILTAIYKGNGICGRCANARGNALICHTAKLYECILEKRARMVTEPQLGINQHT